MWSWFSLILGSLLVGVLIGYHRILPEKALVLSDKITTLGLLVLLWAMGAQIGANDQIINDLGVIGTKAVFLAAGGVAASIILVAYFEKLTSRKSRLEKGGDNL